MPLWSSHLYRYQTLNKWDIIPFMNIEQMRLLLLGTSHLWWQIKKDEIFAGDLCSYSNLVPFNVSWNFALRLLQLCGSILDPTISRYWPSCLSGYYYYQLYCLKTNFGMISEKTILQLINYLFFRVHDTRSIRHALFSAFKLAFIYRRISKSSSKQNYKMWTRENETIWTNYVEKSEI